MSQPRHEMTTKPVLHRRPGTEAVRVREPVPYGDGGRTLTIYEPPEAGAKAEPRPAVLFVSGYPDPGFAAMFGCRLEQMQGYVDWARLVASTGLVAVTYANVEPVADLRAVIEHLRAHGSSLGIDAARLGLWASSGNVPAALGALVDDGGQSLRCAALCYGYTLDLDGSTAVADAAAQFHFANPAAGKTIEELPASVPLMLVRAGADPMPGLLPSLDRFAAGLRARDRPLDVLDLPGAPHAFDLEDDSERTRGAIDAVLSFLMAQLDG